MLIGMHRTTVTLKKNVVLGLHKIAVPDHSILKLWWVPPQKSTAPTRKKKWNMTPTYGYCRFMNKYKKSETIYTF